MTEIRRWFDSHSSPQVVEGFDPLASGYTTSGEKVRLTPSEYAHLLYAFQVRLFTMPATFLGTRCMYVCATTCRLNRYTFADAERTSRGTVYFGGQNEALPALMRTHRVPTPEWAAAEDRKVLKESESKRDIAKSLKPLQDLHFADFEGNLGVQRARTAVLASRLTPPKGWGAGHTHVSGFRSPPWKERPPQEAPRYKCPNLLRERDLFIQVGFRPCVEG